MTASTHRRLIAEDVDVPALFDQAEALFGGDLDILRVVAASRQRALFLVRDRVLKRSAALRVQFDPESPVRAWFQRETELLAALDHPVLRPIYAAGFRENWAYRIAKWIEGESLQAATARAPRPIPSVLHLARELTNFLEYVHTQRIVVRQLTPASVMLDQSERTILTDLRYANVCLDAAIRPHAPEWLAFVAPELREGASGEPLSDLYTIGAILYAAITGVPPAEDAEAIVSPREHREACPHTLERIIMRALRRQPTERYLTAAEMRDDLLSDFGEHDPEIAVAPQPSTVIQDTQAWEKRLRRALGDDYELLNELGSGGFGTVYRVRDLALEREVALKVLHPYLTADPDVVERFRREARLAAQLHHPNIVDIYDIGGRAGLLWYTMEFIEGRNLSHIVEHDGPVSVEQLCDILEETLDALSHAHQRGLVHRDLKPENLLIENATDMIRITDFGLALAVQKEERFGGASSHSGTPEFAAPEQLLGERVDHRADIYSLALVAFYALTGCPPFVGATVESILAHHAAGKLPDITEYRNDVPDRLARVIGRGAGRYPAERFPSAESFASAIRQAIHPWRQRLRRWVSALVQR